MRNRLVSKSLIQCPWCKGWKGGELQGLAQLSHVVRLIGNRASSLFKHGAPPYCYSNVLKSRDTLDARLLKQMKWDWTSL